jgi:hypothetical protein
MCYQVSSNPKDEKYQERSLMEFKRERFDSEMVQNSNRVNFAEGVRVMRLNQEGRIIEIFDESENSSDS